MWKDKTTRQDGDKEEKLINYHKNWKKKDNEKIHNKSIEDVKEQNKIKETNKLPSTVAVGINRSKIFSLKEKKVKYRL